MTTQIPQYPTTPPWAPPPAEHEPPPAPYTPTHGRLMVAFPELLHTAGRPPAKSWVPVVVLTLLFGPFGAISAARRAGHAPEGGNPRYPYWLAFGVTMVAWAILWSIPASRHFMWPSTRF